MFAGINKVFGKTFEKKLAVKTDIIAADPLRDILQFPLDDVQVKKLPFGPPLG